MLSADNNISIAIKHLIFWEISSTIMILQNTGNRTAASFGWKNEKQIQVITDYRH
jgi:hypothetical protein